VDRVSFASLTQTPVVVIDTTRQPDGTDLVELRGVFATDDHVPPRLRRTPPDEPNTVGRQRFTVPIGEVVNVPLFRFTVGTEPAKTTAREQGSTPR
jgi:hypothetical protein